MPFKKPNSKYWKVRRKRLPSYGDSGTLSTGTTRKKIASMMEEVLERVAERGLTDPAWFSLLEALRPVAPGQSGRLTLPELVSGYNAGRAEQLILELKDPGLAGAIEEYLRTETDYQTENGLRMLRDMVPAGEKLTYLRSGKNIAALCRQAERSGLSRNYVRRSLYNATSKLVGYHLGQAERDRIFANVSFAAANDARDVFLSPPEIRTLLKACDFHEEVPAYPHVAQLRPIVHLALVTSADRGPLLRLRVKDVELARTMSGEAYGVVHLRDRKASSRPRSMAITGVTCKEIEPFLMAKEPADKVFTIRQDQLRYWFVKARSAAGLEHVRFKDLRHTYAVHADKAGMSLSEIQNAMGHKDATMSLRYTKYQAVNSREDAERLMGQMGLIAPKKLKKPKLG